MSRSVRPSADISTLLPGGPTACEARDALSSDPAVETSDVVAPSKNATFAFGSRRPNGFTPLKWFCARPSQKLRKLKTALITDGVLRPVVRRTFAPFETNGLPGAAMP